MHKACAADINYLVTHSIQMLLLSLGCCATILFYLKPLIHFLDFVFSVTEMLRKLGNSSGGHWWESSYINFTRIKLEYAALHT